MDKLDSIASLRDLLDRRILSAEELLREYINKIEEKEPVVGAFLTLDREGALALARESDARLARGEKLHLLDGIPFAVKDNLCTRGLRTTCASRMLEGYIPPYDATVVSRLRERGGILLGKTNMDEFGMGSSTEHSALGVTRNPHDPTRVAGGSSGGSAAAVAAGQIPYALGSDTGGSVRQPAAFCGVVGLKPTYGALSRYGLTAFASSLDCVGVLARTSRDCATVFDALIGRDPMDATTRGRDSFRKALPLPSIRIGVAEIPNTDLAPIEAAKKALSDGGFALECVGLPDATCALAAYYVISSAEASSNLARFDGVRYGLRAEGGSIDALMAESRMQGLGEEVRRRILFGTYVLSAENRESYYLRACLARERITRALLTELTQTDVLLLPTVPDTAFCFGEKLTAGEMYAADLCTVYASLAGLPALSVPFGRDERGLPRAVQLIGRPGEEATLLALAAFLEEVDV